MFGTSATVDRVFDLQRKLEGLTDRDLKRQGQDLAWKARAGWPLKGLLPEVFAIGVEASRRTLGKTHYPVQVQGGITIFEGCIAEMQTGEGKTLTAVLPAMLRAMVGRGCHVITANEYLASRDADLMRPVYQAVGLTVSCVKGEMQDDDRREAYAKDITYGTASEVGFDFLRDRIKTGASEGNTVRRAVFTAGQSDAQTVQRGHYFALIDEADSILIDEAKTPLIIGMELPNRAAMTSLYKWAQQILPRLELDQDFLYEPRRKQVHLTETGSHKVTLLSKPPLLDSIDTERIFQHVEKALVAEYAFVRDKDYVIVDDEISIVDEGTGRIMEGRKWQEGLHQAIEAKEHLPITPITTSAARVTIQTLYRHYPHLAGMTGTAVQSRRELKKIYKLSVDVVPTHRPCIRSGATPRVFATLAAKRQAIVAAVRELVSIQRSVLIGTPSVEASEALSQELNAVGQPHVVLNARAHEREAEIVAEAGRPGRVTIATNMAGRGTDILLEDATRTAGGLHVIATEMHTSSRIDRQLVGRAARQGDPGSFQFFLSLQDELLRTLTPQKRARWQLSARPDANGELSSSYVTLFQRTQRQLEKLHTKQRKQLLKQEREQLKKYRRIGLDPFLELVEG
ncbi:MAG: translocase [Planctomycetaceae bacterium]